MTQTQTQTQTQSFESTDPDLANEILRDSYTSMKISFRGTRPLLRIARIPFGRARLDRVTFRMAVGGAGNPLETINLLHVRSGTAHYSYGPSTGRSEETYGPGDTAFPCPTGLGWTLTIDDPDCDVLLLDPALLAEVAGSAPEGPDVRLLSDRPRHTRQGAQLWRLATSLGDQARADPAAWSSPLVTDTADRLLAAMVLSTFPHSADVEPTIEDRHDAHPASVRRAIAFIEAHPDQPISTVDIARAACVSPRALQLAFRRHLDTTPMTYLRRVRLERAHTDLQAADPDDLTVTAIAARWGFGNAGRFAALYARAYGRTPKSTLGIASGSRDHP